MTRDHDILDARNDRPLNTELQLRVGRIHRYGRRSRDTKNEQKTAHGYILEGNGFRGHRNDAPLVREGNPANTRTSQSGKR